MVNELQVKKEIIQPSFVSLVQTFCELKVEYAAGNIAGNTKENRKAKCLGEEEIK